MDVIKKQMVDTVVDRKCDVCNKSLYLNVGKVRVEESGVLKANFGYGSSQDGKSYHLDLCEKCFMIALSALRDERFSNPSLGEEHVKLEDDFGLDLPNCSHNI